MNKSSTPHGWNLARIHPRILDVLLVLALFALAIFVRLPYYMTIPVITDETREVLSALSIARGESFPLTNVSTYIGPIFLYLLAGAFRLFGVSPELPRLFVLVIGALTVAATYWLGKLWSNRLAAFLGAGLFVTSATHIWVNSHIANSASTTPFFTTLTIIALTYAQRKGSARWWLVAGFLYGLALLSHPTVILLAPPLVLWVVLNPANRKQLRTLTPYLSIVAAVIAFSPLLVHNVLTLGSTQGSLSSIARRTYAFGLPENVGDYFAQVLNTAVDILRSFAAQFVTLSTVTDYLQFIVLVYVVLLLAAVIFLLRRGNTLPALVFLLTPMLLALFVRTAIFPYDTRYYAFVLPIGYISIGILLDACLRGIWNWMPRDTRWTHREIHLGALPALPVHRLVRAVVVAFVLLNLIRLALYPLYALVGVNQFFLQNGPNSFGMIDLAQRARTANAQVWLDSALTGPDYWMCNGVTAGEALEYLLILNAVPVKTVDLESSKAPAPGSWLAATPANAARLGAQTNLKPIAATASGLVHCAPAVIQLYEIES